MNYRFLFYTIGIIMLILAALLLIPLLVSAIYGESILPFLYTILIITAAALPTALLCRTKDRRMYAKDGMVAVSIAWLLMSAFGTLPFIFSGAIPSFIDAFFETVSGFTTTGATLLPTVENLPRGILFYRSFTHWIGGMGVIVFMLAILPTRDGRIIQLMRAEMPGPTKGKLVPKLKETALILWGIYLALTVLEIIALLICGLPFFDSVVNTFSTTGTGGFSVLNNSIAGYNNPAAEWVIAIFMFLCGINFNIYFFIIIKNFSGIFKNSELKLYTAICAIATAVITLNVWTSCADSFSSVGECIRTAFFQVTSIISTTGFVTVNYDMWPELSRMIILLLTFIGACAGSTAGGFKLSRLVILGKMMRGQLRERIKPQSVKAVRIDGEALDEKTCRSVSIYLAFYAAIIAAATLVVSIDGFDFLTNFSAVATCFNNVGPGLGAIVGPVGNFSSYSDFSTIVLSFTMLFGRLEIIPMLILFSPSSWRK